MCVWMCVFVYMQLYMGVCACTVCDCIWVQYVCVYVVIHAVYMGVYGYVYECLSCVYGVYAGVYGCVVCIWCVGRCILYMVCRDVYTVYGV